MMASRHGPALLAVAVLVVAAPASGDSYTVILVNGARIESRYEPRPAPDDADKLLLLTETGNRISLDRRHVSEIRSSAGTPGFDREIDTRPRFVGRAPNDKPVVAPASGSRPGATVTAAVLDHLLQQSLAAIEGRLRLARANTVPQFGEPPVAGVDLGTGLPLGQGSATGRYLDLLQIQRLTNPPPPAAPDSGLLQYDLLLQGLALPPDEPGGALRPGPMTGPLLGVAGAPPSVFVPSSQPPG